MDACFSAFDKDQDGFLSVAEFELICKALFRNDRGKVYALEEDRLKDIFQVFDTDGNGLIDRKEFEVCAGSRRCLMQPLHEIGFELAVAAF